MERACHLLLTEGAGVGGWLGNRPVDRWIRVEDTELGNGVGMGRWNLMGSSAREQGRFTDIAQRTALQNRHYYINDDGNAKWASKQRTPVLWVAWMVVAMTAPAAVTGCRLWITLSSFGLCACSLTQGVCALARLRRGVGIELNVGAAKERKACLNVPVSVGRLVHVLERETDS